MGELNSDNHYNYYCGHESFGRNGVAFRVNKRVQNAVLECTLKKKHNDFSLFPRQIIQHHNNTSLWPNHWCQGNWHWSVLWRPRRSPRISTKKRCPSHHRGLECKSRKSILRGWDSGMASPIQWTWTWANSRRWWGTGKPGVLQPLGSQRVRHNSTAE